MRQRKQSSHRASRLLEEVSRRPWQMRTFFAAWVDQTLVWPCERMGQHHYSAAVLPQFGLPTCPQETVPESLQLQSLRTSTLVQVWARVAHLERATASFWPQLVGLATVNGASVAQVWDCAMQALVGLSLLTLAERSYLLLLAAAVLH